MTGAAGVMESTVQFHRAGSGSNPRAALHSLRVTPVPQRVARELIVRHHYLHSYPGGTKLSFGVFAGSSLSGALTFGAGPAQVHRLVEGCDLRDCLTLTRFWLDDALPRNSESRVLGVIVRYLRRCTGVRFIVAYADPARGHTGAIYRAAGWTYTGLSNAVPLYKVAGRRYHSRTFAFNFGTRSVQHFREHGVDVETVPQSRKHRYVKLLDPTASELMTAPALPYPQGVRP
ncbi:MAG: DNA methyltransferase [SAR202 cluster bacterium Io17-Chloro-G1]|nr:MAG: DNA methyltransferase [SAR202 cluster bacterium Io17-Chloro-G1]